MSVGLERWARGAYDLEAAVMMLTRCSLWPRLYNELLARNAIGYDDFGNAWIDRDEILPVAQDNGMSGGERRVLWLVVSLLSLGGAPGVGDLVPGIGDADTSLFLHATAHLAGWHQRDRSLTVTGAA